MTASNVILSVQAGIPNKIVQRTAGTTLTAGKSYYLDANNLAQLADANASSTTAAGVGIALGGAGANQPFFGFEGGALSFGAVLTQGLVYVVSATAGGIAPTSDLTTGWFTTILGYAQTTSILVMPQTGPIVSGAALS